MKLYDAIYTMNRLFEQLVLNINNVGGYYHKCYGFNPTEGIRFSVKIDAGYKDRYDRKYFHVIMLSHKNIFTSISDISDIDDEMIWKNTSNHVSCWRDDGCRDLHKLCQQVYATVTAGTPEKQLPSIASVVDISLDLSISGNVFEFITCDRVYNSDESVYNISNIRQIKKIIQL